MGIEIAYLLYRALSALVSIYLFALFCRVVIDWVRFFAGTWRPPAPLMILFNVIYALTDPPLKLLHRFIPPARIGAVSLDVSFIVLFFLVILVRWLAWWGLLLVMRFM